MEFSLETADFGLHMELRIFDDEKGCPSDTITSVEVESHGFSGRASMDISVKELIKFADDLSGIYECLTGKARLRETFGNMYISFAGDGRGHIGVEGMLSMDCHCLEFENIVDQTDMKEFSDKLRKALSVYRAE